ncbi:hypothetical protein Nepgr_007783 [Nepenthes gracilis]|uniref:Uncharacterized protein n=1 Tax=Nepenthes gracilis TaxID=150966 RepID=A0AAD3S7H2_NEPGR|nr:hypothetical protein Nepgr_007783 [Nepenthes gracilis]
MQQQTIATDRQAALVFEPNTQKLSILKDSATEYGIIESLYGTFYFSCCYLTANSASICGQPTTPPAPKSAKVAELIHRPLDLQHRRLEPHQRQHYLNRSIHPQSQCIHNPSEAHGIEPATPLITFSTSSREPANVPTATSP